MRDIKFEMKTTGAQYRLLLSNSINVKDVYPLTSFTLEFLGLQNLMKNLKTLEVKSVLD